MRSIALHLATLLALCAFAVHEPAAHAAAPPPAPMMHFTAADGSSVDSLAPMLFATQRTRGDSKPNIFAMGAAPVDCSLAGLERIRRE